MKKLVGMAMLFASLAFTEAKSQMVNNVKLSDLKEDYIELREARVGKKLNSHIYVSLNYGQKIDDTNANTYVRDDKGVELDFNSILDAVNKMKNYGYELFQVYVMMSYSPGFDRTTDGTTAVKYYIMKRK